MRGQLELAPHSGLLKGCSFAFGVDVLVALVIQAYASGFETFGQSGFAKNILIEFGLSGADGIARIHKHPQN